MPIDSDRKALDELIQSTLALITQFTASLRAEISDPSERDHDSSAQLNPLSILSDAAKLLKAHTTRLSLLAINKPFTPSAVAKVLRELTSTCLPAMMSAVQICACDPASWPRFLVREVQIAVQRVLSEMQSLLREVQAVSSGVSDGSTGRGRDSLSNTGVVWESCDALIDLDRIGVAGLAVKKAEQYRDTIKDAIAELQEWKEGDDLESESHGDKLLDSDDEGVDGDHDSIEDIFHAPNSMPKDRPTLEKLVSDADNILKKIIILYAAIIKRRLGIFKASISTINGESDTSRLDSLMQQLRRLPHQVDEMAGAFYDLNETHVQEILANCVQGATEAGLLTVINWEGTQDRHSEWFSRWREAIALANSTVKP